MEIYKKIFKDSMMGASISALVYLILILINNSLNENSILMMSSSIISVIILGVIVSLFASDTLSDFLNSNISTEFRHLISLNIIVIFFALGPVVTNGMYTRLVYSGFSIVLYLLFLLVKYIVTQRDITEINDNLL